MMKKTFAAAAIAAALAFSASAFAAPGPEGQPPAPGPQMDQKAPPAPKAQPKHLKKAPHRTAPREEGSEADAAPRRS